MHAYRVRRAGDAAELDVASKRVVAGSERLCESFAHLASLLEVVLSCLDEPTVGGDCATECATQVTVHQDSMMTEVPRPVNAD